VDNRCGGLEAPTQDACGANPNPASDSVPAGLPGEVGDEERWAVRGLLLFEPPNTTMEWLLNLHASSIDQNSTLGQAIGTRFPRVQSAAGYIDPAVSKLYAKHQQRFRDAGLSAVQARRAAYLPTLKDVTNDIDRADPLDGAYDLVGQERLHGLGGSLRGTMSFGDVDIETISGMESYDRERLTDFDFSPDATLQTDAEDRAWQVSQSFDLSSEFEQLLFRWNTGGYFLADSLDANTNFLFNFNQSAILPARMIRQTYTQDDYSFGLYGNFEWEFAEVFTLEGGVRFNYDKKDFELSVTRVGNPRPSSTSETWTAPTGAIALRYRPTESVSMYAKYSHGWKPGVFNAAVLFNQDTGGGSFRPEIKKTDPEELDAFEVGLNASWLGGALETRLALFYYKYSDYQVFIFRNSFGAPPQFEIVNADDAQIYGAEVDVFAEPLQGLVPEFFEQLILEARFSWLESEFLDFTDTNTIFAGVNFVTQVVDFSGNRLPNSPRFKLSTTARYAFDLGRFGTITPRYDLTYTHEVFFDPSEGRGAPRPDILTIAPGLPRSPGPGAG
jgi:iron complex outermembrane receptor protein